MRVIGRLEFCDLVAAHPLAAELLDRGTRRKGRLKLAPLDLRVLQQRLLGNLVVPPQIKHRLAGKGHDDLDPVQTQRLHRDVHYPLGVHPLFQDADHLVERRQRVRIIGVDADVVDQAHTAAEIPAQTDPLLHRENHPHKQRQDSDDGQNPPEQSPPGRPSGTSRSAAG